MFSVPKRGKHVRVAGAKQTPAYSTKLISASRSESAGNGETLPPAGKRGAAAALERLEASEERAHARLEAALGPRRPARNSGMPGFLT
jgi:hypothetical protein